MGSKQAHLAGGAHGGQHGTPRATAGEFSPPGLRESAAVDELGAAALSNVAEGGSQVSSSGAQKAAQEDEKGTGGPSQQEQEKQRGGSPAALEGAREKAARESYAPEYEHVGKGGEAGGGKQAAGSGSPASETLELREQSSSGGAPGGEAERRGGPVHPKAAS